MPYIADDKRRADLDSGFEPVSAGELTYLLFRLVRGYWCSRPIGFQTASDILGALRSTQLEFERRLLAPYEDAKKADNRDVEGKIWRVEEKAVAR